VADAEAGRLFEATLAAAQGLDAKPVANWVTGDYLRIRNAATDPVNVDPSQLARLVSLVGDGTINRSSARDVLDAHASSGDPVDDIVARLGLRQISDAGALTSIVDGVLAANPAAVADIRAGKGQAIGFLVGQVMKATKGQANAAVATAAIRERLDGSAAG
jgi:aspartyl-tRNA(Asn)/glutamyl-tRNA(Gln) amidotransferase subunit B